jgi:hypothetical protein
MFFFVITVLCMVWLHLVVRKMLKEEAPEQLERIESVLREPLFEATEARPESARASLDRVRPEDGPK